MWKGYPFKRNHFRNYPGKSSHVIPTSRASGGARPVEWYANVSLSA
jgi:hypothetical protein